MLLYSPMSLGLNLKNLSRRMHTRYSVTTSLFVIGLCSSGNSGAISKPYDAEAQVIMKDGLPCFFAPMANEKPPKFGQTIKVHINRGQTVWHIAEEHGTEQVPSNIDRCVKYGTTWRTGATIKEPAPLQDGVPYIADIGSTARFRVTFCLSRTAQGEQLLTEWTEDGYRCTDEPLNDADKPSIWQRMFGK